MAKCKIRGGGTLNSGLGPDNGRVPLQCRICVIDYLRLIIFLNVIAPRTVMCSFMLICQCCFAIVNVLLKKVTDLLIYSSVCNNLSWGNALNHKLEVGERRSLASHYTLTTASVFLQFLILTPKPKTHTTPVAL